MTGSPEGSGPIRVKRLSIMDGQFKAVVSQHPSHVELLLDSKNGGDVYGRDIGRGELPGCGGLLEEPQQVYEFLVQALEVAQPLPKSGGASEHAKAGGPGLVCYIWECDKGARMRASMKPQYAFMKPMEVSLQLPMVAYATMQQKIAIQLQTQASMSQQLLTEQMVGFSKQVDNQRAQFERVVGEKLSSQTSLMLQQVAQFEAKVRDLDRQTDEKLSTERQSVRALADDVAQLRQELETQTAQMAVAMRQGVDELRQEMQLAVELAKVDLRKERLGNLPKGVYYVIARGGKGKSNKDPGSARPVSPARTPVRPSHYTTPARSPVPGRKPLGVKKPLSNTPTMYRCWTSGSIGEDELWYLFVSEFHNRTRAEQGKDSRKALRLVRIEPETEYHRNNFDGDSRIGDDGLSPGSVGPDADLICEFVFP
jgi:hypothetical protein